MEKPLRLWPGVVIVALQLALLHIPAWVAPSSMAMFYGMMASMTMTLLVIVWWLFFSRARWIDRLGGLALLIGLHALAIALLVDPSAKWTAMLPGIPWLCAAFVGSLFFGKRSLTVVAVLVASLGWTLVRTDGVWGTMDTDYAWRWSATAEDRFLASDASAAPATPAAAAVVETAAWPGFRGAGRDSILAGVSVDPDWSANPPQELWRRPVGPGWSSFTLVGRQLCTQEQRDENEVVVCYDAATGEPLWLHADEARFWEALGGAGPRATPSYHEGRLYTLGATGILNCLDAAGGGVIWSRNIAEDSGAEIPDWGFSSSPLIVDDLVVVHAAGAPDDRGVRAYDLAAGEPRWSGEPGGRGYSSPQLATIDGVRQIVMFSQGGVVGLEPASGTTLWKHDWPATGGGERVIQPTVLADGSGILAGTFDEGTRKIAVSADASGEWAVSEVWTSRGLKPYYNDLVVHRGTAFGFDRSILSAIDVGTGERKWKGGRYGNGQMLLLPDQDLLLIVSERGELVLVRATAERHEEVALVPAIEGKTWNHPIVADGVVYLRNAEEAAAFRLPG